MSADAKERAAGVELDVADPRWLDFVSGHDNALPYHHPAWAELFAECYGFRTFALAITDGSGRISAGLPVAEVNVPLRGRRWVSLPFTDYLPPLADDDASLARLLAELAARRTQMNVRAVELRAEVQGPGIHRLTGAYTHVLALQKDPELVFQTFTRMVQRAIRKGEREGARVRRGERREDLTHAFYELHSETRRRHGTPVQPRRFFELIWTRLVEPGLASVLLADVDGRPVAGVVFLTWNRTVVYKYSATSREYSRYRPTNLIIWDAIRSACEEGHRVLDFGRTDEGDEGLRAFKQGWGTDERPLVYSAIAERAPAPMRTSRLLETIIRRSPTFVARALGTIFYRFAG